MSEAYLAWDIEKELSTNTENVLMKKSNTITTPEYADTRFEVYKTEKRYGIGKPYRIIITGDIKSDSGK